MNPENEIDLKTYYNGLDEDSFSREKVESLMGRHVVRKVEIADHVVVDGNRGTVIGWERSECEYTSSYRFQAKVAWQDRDGNRLENGNLLKQDLFSAVRWATEKGVDFPDYEGCCQEDAAERSYSDFMRDQNVEIESKHDFSSDQYFEHDQGIDR